MTKYIKTAVIKAEQFDGSEKMANKYQITLMPPATKGGHLHTLEGSMLIHIGDWIATGVNGEHWVIKDEIFKKTYREVTE